MSSERVYGQGGWPPAGGPGGPGGFGGGSGFSPPPAGAPPGQPPPGGAKPITGGEANHRHASDDD